MTPQQAHQQVDAIVAFFETLSPSSIESFDTLYHPQARFKDPFNDVVGLPGIESVFRHMFENLDEPRFLIARRVVQAGPQGVEAFLTWDFTFRMKRWNRQSQRIHGGSYLRLDEGGHILEHRDYWDAAEELYAKLPVIGAAMRWLRRRAAS